MTNFEPVPFSIAELIVVFVLNLAFLLFLPLYLMGCFIIVEQNEVVVLTAFGKIRKVLKEPGCHFNPHLTYNKISTKPQTIKL